MADKFETEYTADESEQTSHLADDKMSLKSKLGGGGRDLGEQSATEQLRLCPGCGRVTTFVQGVCSNCDYRPGAQDVQTAPPFAYQAAGGSSSATRVLLILLIVIVLAAAGYFGWKMFAKPGASTEPPLATSSGTAPDETAGSSAAAGGASGATAGRGLDGSGAAVDDTHPGSLQAIVFDEALHSEIKQALEAGNAAWKAAGSECYIYRYRLFESTVPATSQVVRITAFAGGANAELATVDPGDAPFRTALKPLLDKLQAHPGVSVTLLLESLNGSEAPDPKDVYIRYGYYFGLEHMDELQPLIDALKTKYDDDGEYPLQLSSNITRPMINTNGGLYFTPNGFGYLPVFKTDAAGKIVMGQGK
jgi:hypothetical protein